jgi:hypothetical protein
VATITYTPNLSLKISSDDDAITKYNLGRIDYLAQKINISVSGSTVLSSSTNVDIFAAYGLGVNRYNGVITIDAGNLGTYDTSSKVQVNAKQFNVATNGGSVTIEAATIDLNGGIISNQTLAEYNIHVGDGSNIATAVNTNTVGDVLANASTGLTVKDGTITDNKIVGVSATKVSGLTTLLSFKADITYVDGQDAAQAAYTSLVSSALTSHKNDTSNPHSVTAAQTGAYTTTQVDSLLTNKTNQSDFSAHILNTSNPHNTTASQVGAYTTGEVNALIAGVAGGKAAVSSTDTTADYLENKIAHGSGIDIVKSSDPGDALLTISNTDTGSAAMSTHLGSFVHADIAHANRAALDSISGSNTGDETTSTIKTKLGAASAGADGYLTSADWSTFNGKQAALGFTPDNAAQMVRVAKSGSTYTSIQTAINSISDASSTKPYVVLVAPGVYTESITIKDWVFIKGVETNGSILANTSTLVTGTITAGAKSGIDSMTLALSPNSAANASAIEITGDAIFANLEIDIRPGTSFSGTLKGISIASNNLAYIGLFGVNLYDISGATITEFCGVELQGTNTLSLYQAAVNIFSLAGSGTFKNYCLSNTGDTGARELLAYSIFYNPAFSGTVIGYNCQTATTSDKVRIVKSSAAILKGATGGTAYATRLDTSGSTGLYRYDGMIIHLTGFANEYTSTTGTNDSQQLQITSLNKDLEVASAGLSVITPFDANSSGFVRWGGAGSYYSYNTGTREFTLLRPGAGIVHSAPVTWAGSQTTTLANLATNYVYVNSVGVLQSTTSADRILYIEGVVLFEVWVEGTNYIVTKENHPYEFTTAVSNAWHNTFGPLVTGLGATLTQLGVAANRQLAIVGDDTVIDHGLDTTITSAPAVAATFKIVYTNAAGKMAKDGADLTTFLSRYNNAGTPANASNTRRIVIRIGVLKDDLNSSTPIYVGCLHTTTYGNDSSALAAISGGNIVAFPAELKALEVVQLGFIVINANGSGAGSIINGGVVVAKQAFGAALIGASSATQASLITTSTTNFTASGGITSILSGADTTVQAALDTLTRGISSRYAVALSWAGVGPYTMSITGATHLRGTDPIVRVRELTGGTTYEVVNPDKIEIDGSNGDVTITSTSNFTGTVVIL